MEFVNQLEYILQFKEVRYAMAAMVIARMVFKPFFLVLGKYVELTVEQDDDKKLHSVMNSKAYKMLAYIVDMSLSVKIPQITKKVK